MCRRVYAMEFVLHHWYGLIPEIESIDTFQSSEVLLLELNAEIDSILTTKRPPIDWGPCSSFAHAPACIVYLPKPPIARTRRAGSFTRGRLRTGVILQEDAPSQKTRFRRWSLGRFTERWRMTF